MFVKINCIMLTIKISGSSKSARYSYVIRVEFVSKYIEILFHLIVSNSWVAPLPCLCIIFIAVIIIINFSSQLIFINRVQVNFMILVKTVQFIIEINRFWYCCRYFKYYFASLIQSSTVWVSTIFIYKFNNIFIYYCKSHSTGEKVASYI